MKNMCFRTLPDIRMWYVEGQSINKNTMELNWFFNANELFLSTKQYHQCTYYLIPSVRPNRTEPVRYVSVFSG